MSVRIVSLKLHRPLLWGTLALLVLLLMLLLLLNLRSSPTDEASETKNLYAPGIYSTSLVFGTEVLTMEMTFSEASITAVSCSIPDSIQTLYPLVAPTLSSLSAQLLEGLDLDSVQIDGSSLDTASYLKDAISSTIQRARCAQ